MISPPSHPIINKSRRAISVRNGGVNAMQQLVADQSAKRRCAHHGRMHHRHIEAGGAQRPDDGITVARPGAHPHRTRLQLQGRRA